MEASNRNDCAHQTGLSLKEIAGRYTNWANDYENDLCPENYRGPKIVVDRLEQLFPHLSSRGGLRILDAAAGTGFVALQAEPVGFQKLDALEPSEGMMDILREKKLYNNTYLEFLDDKPTPIPADTYDAVVIAGGMGEGHIPCNGLNDLPRLTKPGGYVVIAMREAYLQGVSEYKDRLEPHMAEMESKGLWKMVERKVIPRYSFSNNGILYTFQV